MKKVISFALFLLATVSVLFILITAGALEQNSITVHEAVKWFVSAAAVLLPSIAFGMVIDKEKERWE